MSLLGNKDAGFKTVQTTCVWVCISFCVERPRNYRFHRHIHEAWGVDSVHEGVSRVSVNGALNCRGSQAIIVDLHN